MKGRGRDRRRGFRRDAGRQFVGRAGEALLEGRVLFGQVLNWTQYVGFDLAPYPNVAAHRARLQARPSVARAMDEELELFRQAA